MGLEPKQHTSFCLIFEFAALQHVLGSEKISVKRGISMTEQVVKSILCRAVKS